MRVVRYSHACVRIEHEGQALVIDPGTWSEPEALIGADAVLVTHEHSDHVDRLRLAGLGAPVFAPEGADLRSLVATRVSVGKVFEAAGMRVHAVGGTHAAIWAGEAAVVSGGFSQRG